MMNRVVYTKPMVVFMSFEETANDAVSYLANYNLQN